MNIQKQKNRLIKRLKQTVLMIPVCVSVLFVQGCNVDAGIVLPWELPNWDIAWSERWKGTQIDQMIAIGMEMDAQGSTYSVGQMNLEDGSRWGVVIKYNRFGIKEAQQIFQAGGDNRTLPLDVTMDSDGYMYIVGERQDAGDWFAVKIDTHSANLDILWDVAHWPDGNGAPYTLAVNNDAVLAAGSGQGWNRYAVAIWDKVTGNLVYNYERGCCSNGAIRDPKVWDAISVEHTDGNEWFYVTYPGPSGSTGDGGKDMEIRYYQYDKPAGTTAAGQNWIDVDSNASNYRFAEHPDGYLVFAGNRDATAKVFKITLGSTGIDTISPIIQFEKAFRFRAMTFDDTGSIYIAGDTINVDSPENTNAYIAKYDASCVDVHTDLCWDHTFNHTMLFNISVSLMGIDLVETFTKEEVRDIFIANNFVYMMTSSETSNANVASKQVTELIGFSKGSGNPANQIQIKASDSAAAQLNPYDPSRVHVVGVNVNADLTADPDIYLYTHAVQGF